MATLDRRYYYLPRRAVNAAVLGLVLLVALGGLAAWATAERWLPEVARVLDVDVPVADPDALVVNAAGQSAEVDRRLARLVAERPGRVIVLLGSPFTSDVLVPERTSGRLRSLAGFGVPRSAIVELYEGETLYQSLEALRGAARARGWRSVVNYGTSPGTRRVYLASRAILGPAGIEVGSVTVPSPAFNADGWWHDNRDRGRVVFAWLALILGRLTGRY
jgi:hypothetical protein